MENQNTGSCKYFLNFKSISFLKKCNQIFLIDCFFSIPARYRNRVLQLLKKLYPEDYRENEDGEKCDHFEW
jgi:hypothetical protein